jgi:uncharacterized DUF497 family protein
VKIEWDPAKNAENLVKHGVSFEEASDLFNSERDFLEIFDEAHSEDEERLIAIGLLRSGVIVIVWTERHEDTIRIISARWATGRERLLYAKRMEHDHDQ